MNTRNINRATSLAMLAFVIFCGACSTETTESENIASPGIYARMNVDALSTGSSKVTVELNVGGSNGTNISLTSNERLEATKGNETKIMNRDTDFLDVDYEINFNNSDSSTPFQVTFFRATGEIIDGSSVFLPPNFDISSPSSGQSYVFDQLLPILWAPSDPGRSISLFVTTRCTTNAGATQVSSRNFTINDDGSENFSLSLLDAATNVEIDRNKACEFSVSLERSRTGSIDPDYGSGGSMRSRQARSVDDMVVNFSN